MFPLLFHPIHGQVLGIVPPKDPQIPLLPSLSLSLPTTPPPHGSRLPLSLIELPLWSPNWAHCLLCDLPVVHSLATVIFFNTYVRSPLPPA